MTQADAEQPLSHVDAAGRPAMVDVGDKVATDRCAHARARVILPAIVRAALSEGEIQTAKGPVFATAIIAGTMAAKRTAELIPFCHPLPIESCKLTIAPDEAGNVEVNCRVRVHHKTGVEMEALTGASIAALTIYDMCKALSHDMVISEVALVSKSGGKHDIQRRED